MSADYTNYNEYKAENLSADWLEDKAKFPVKEKSNNTDISDTKTDPSWQWSIGIACVILGIIVSLLFKTYRKEGPGVAFTSYDTRNDLAKMVNYLQTERNRLQTDLANARKTIMQYEDTTTKGKDESSALMEQLEKYRQEAGLTGVLGPGIIVTLKDSPIKPKDGDDPNFYIVHDVDLMALVNELWASGAEAISINEQRLVMTSAIRCVGPTITVNTVRLTPPYVVKAIGPPSNLETGLKYTGGFLDSMSPNIDRGVDIKIKRVKDLTIPAYRGSLINRYAKPYTENTDS